jgi:diguanylate cyclase (GGDEF)-like protein
MGTGFILIVGCIILAAGSGSLMAVRLSNRHLTGLGWLGASFATGGTGALLLGLSGNLPEVLTFLGADGLVLVSFVLLHVSFMESLDNPSLLPRFGLLLVALEVAAYLVALHHLPSAQFRVVAISILIAAQLGQTAFFLVRQAKEGIRAPIWFNITVLVSFCLLNLVRALASFLQMVNSSIGFHIYSDAVYILFILAALGLAFGFFWLTTAQLANKLEHLASTDPLTRIYNRRAFLEWCDREVAKSARTQAPFSLLILDLDHFKRINDLFGHHSGDATLIAVVETMQNAVRGIDILGRWGGEEFVILLPGANAEAAMIVANRVCKAVQAMRLPVFEQKVPSEDPPEALTVSLGLSTWRGPDDTIKDIARRADSALYQAKAAGRNRVLAEV